MPLVMRRRDAMMKLLLNGQERRLQPKDSYGREPLTHAAEAENLLRMVRFNPTEVNWIDDYLEANESSGEQEVSVNWGDCGWLMAKGVRMAELSWK